MEAQMAHPPSGSPPAAYPKWVMLEHKVKGSHRCMGDPKTLVSARTSSGHLIHVSLRLAEPPAASCVCLQTHDDRVDCERSAVVAAHGDSVLIVVRIDEGSEQYDVAADHFVYNAGAAAAVPPRPPSLSLLPPMDQCRLWMGSTGLLRRGEDEIVVAALTTVPGQPDGKTRARELTLFRSGEWSIKQIETGNDQRGVAVGDTVVPVGDRRLCWVDLSAGLHYVPLPVEPHRWVPRWNRSVCVTGGGALKFVDVSPRCCCGGAGASTCNRSLHAFTITTWTMRVDGGGTEMEWVKDAMVDATERVPLDQPLVSIYEPDIICFFLHEPRQDESYCRGRTMGLLMVDMRRKTIRSISRAEDVLPEGMPTDTLVPSVVSDYFNSCSRVDIDKLEVVVGDDDNRLGDGDASNATQRSSCEALGEPCVQASEILAALQEIPSYGLGRDELIKAYSVLSNDNGRRFRSLLSLPMTLRKEWLLMEIKASEP
ncbi:hypothetical protein BS78_05G079200 [Paspalum vaginatum]|nr:hypothetical protein BS78_05G079200 [Paspalum vaginatum]